MSSGLHWTPEAYAEFLRKRGAQTPPVGSPAPAPVVAAPVAAEPAKSLSAEETKVLRAHRSKQAFQALGRLPKGEFNKTERAYADFLEERKRVGQVLWWKFHPMRVRLANNTFYEVDFLVMSADGVLEIHETKGGFTTDKGQLKLKLCGEALPVFRMFKVIKQTKKAGGGWLIEEYSAT
jgi:hypothetical protein